MVEYLRCRFRTIPEKAAAAEDFSDMSPHNMTGYLLTMGISALCACCLFYFSLRKSPEIPVGKATALAVCILPLGIAGGILFAKLFYFLFYFPNIIKQGAASYWLSLNVNKLSYYGGVTGVCLAAALGAKLLHLRPGKVLNLFAPAGALMAAAARFAEYFLYLTGIGAFLDDPLPFPLAVYIEDYEACVLAVFVYEGIFSLTACVLSLIHRNEPRRFLRTLFYLCLPQILLESLREEALNWLFVHVEQLLCFLFVEGVLVWYGFACGPKKFSSWVPAFTGLLVCGCVIVEEFMLDGKIRFGTAFVPVWITYTLMGAGLALLAVMEHRGNRRLYSSTKYALAK